VPLAAVTMGALLAFGIYRYVSTHKVMPPLGIAALSLLALIALLATARK